MSYLTEENDLHQFEAQGLKAEFIEVVKLQVHYAKLLNMYDGGERKRWRSKQEWIQELIATQVPEVDA